MNFEEHAAKSLFCAGRHCGAARHALYQRRRRRPGGREYRALRRQGAGAGRQARQGRRHQARRRTPRKPKQAAQPDPRHAHRRATRSSACWSRSRPRSRASSMPPCCNDPARKAADPVLHRRRHGHRGDRRGKTVGDPASPGRHRWQAVGRRHCGHARWSPSRRGARADRAYSRSPLRRLPRARRRASGDQSAGLARGRSRGRARLQIRARRCGGLSPAGHRRSGCCRRNDGAGAARRRGRPQAHPARRQCRRARQRRRPHHDDHGRRSVITAASPRTSWRSAARPTPKPRSRSTSCCPIPA